MGKKAGVKATSTDGEFSVELAVVGLRFRTKKDAREVLAKSVPIPVDLEREPGNKYDPNAIMVKIGMSSALRALRGHHIGYLTKEAAARLAPKLDAGKIELVAFTVTEIDAAAGDARMDCTFRNV